MIAVAIILIRFIMNDTIQTAEDVERYLQLSTLGTIPLLQTDKRRKNVRKNIKGDKKLWKM